MKTDPFAPDALSCSDFLGGRVRVWQPLKGYRAGIDPVLLAASVPARAGQSVLELGCGGGVALCCLGWRVPGLALAGLEVQPGYAALARDNLAENKLDGEIITADVAQMPDSLRQRQFDHVIANPPYFETGARSVSPDAGREAGRGSDQPLRVWIEAAARRIKPGGTFSMIHRAERLPEMMAGFEAALGTLELIPFVARQGRAPKLVLLRGRKAGRGAFRFHPPVVLHAGNRHETDGDDFAAPLSDVLRKGHALPLTG